MKLRALAQLVCILFPLAALSIASGGKKTDQSTQADPLGGDNAKLIGEWSGAGAVMHIGADKSFSFESKINGVTKSYSGTIKRVDPKTIVVNALVDINMNVQKMPTEVDGSTVMTVEGIDMYKGGLAGNLNAVITSKFKDANGFKKTECPTTVTATTMSFECVGTVSNIDPITDGGTDKKVKVLVTLKTAGSNDYDFKVETPGFVATKIAALTPKSLDVDHVDCGTGVVYMNVGETCECHAINVHTKKPMKVIVTNNGNDDFHFHAQPL